MLRIAQRVQRDGQYETESVLRETARQRRSLQLLYTLERCGLSSHGERLRLIDLHEHARSVGIDL